MLNRLLSRYTTTVCSLGTDMKCPRLLPRGTPWRNSTNISSVVKSPKSSTQVGRLG